MDKYPLTCLVVMLNCVLLGCSVEETERNNPDYADRSSGDAGYYTPGYTGYSYNVSYGENPIYDSGYGPVFWNSRYYTYTGNNNYYSAPTKLITTNPDSNVY